MWRRVRSANIAASKGIDGPSVAFVRLLFEEAPDPDNRRRAHPGAIVDLAIGQVRLVKQTGDMPAFGERPDLCWSAKVEQEAPHLLAVRRSKQGVAQLVRQKDVVAGRSRRK